MFEFIIQKVENNIAWLQDKDGQLVQWPANKLPAEASLGEKIYFQIKSTPEKDKEAKEVLNELLSSNS